MIRHKLNPYPDGPETIIPATGPVVYALFYRSGPDEYDAAPIVAWLHEKNKMGRDFLHGFFVNADGDMALCENDDNFARYGYADDPETTKPRLAGRGWFQIKVLNLWKNHISKRAENQVRKSGFQWMR